MFKPLIVIPLYNHAQTLPTVVDEVKKYFADILVVNDGSTDLPPTLLSSLHTAFISLPKNKGKGAAIQCAAAYAQKQGYTHLFTIDADNQHYAADLLVLSQAAQANPHALIVGARDFEVENVPGSSKFGRTFSAFWARVQTGQKITDIQSGLRAYPVEVFQLLRLRESRYSFEMEVVVRALWAGFEVQEVAVRVWYPPKEKRVSHFHSWWDNVRISWLNTRLTVRALVPIPHKKYGKNQDGHFVSLNPFTVLMAELKKKETPFVLGISAAWSVFWGSLALPGVRTICLLLGIGYLNLNRPVALTMDKLALPPFIPALCIEAGHFLLHGRWLTEFNWTTLGYQAPQRVWEWVVGSLVVAPMFALLVGFIVFLVGKLVRQGVKKYGN